MEVTGALGRGETAKKYTVNYDFGADLDAAVKLFGPQVIFDGFVGKEVINLQNLIRTAINAGKKSEEIDKLAAAWKPGIKVSRKKSQYEKTLATVGDLTPEQLATIQQAAAAELAKRKK